MELVFDYGDHDTNVPTPPASPAWPARIDPFSSYKVTPPWPRADR
jgi:hypothetical protein